MKITKIFFSVLLGALAFAVSSCNTETVEYRQTDGDCKFVIKKIDGKRQWGMADARDDQEYIPCQYDSIFSAYGAPYGVRKLFIAVKDGKMYAWNHRGKCLLGGRAFTSFVSNKQNAFRNKSVLGGGALFHEAAADKDVMFFYLAQDDWFEFGPTEAVLWGQATALCKKNGKWGVSDTETFQEITPCIYDEVISVGEAYFWVKKDRKWSAIWRDGKTARKSTALLNKYLKMPAMDSEQYRKEKNSALFRKITLEEASYIAINPYDAKYIAW